MHVSLLVIKNNGKLCCPGFSPLPQALQFRMNFLATNLKITHNLSFETLTKK